jgi:hypothetical protein
VSRLTQSIDVGPTFLDLYGVAAPPETEGRSLFAEEEREAVIFGYFGGAVNVTDGRYTYHRFPADIEKQEIFQYTLMPTHMAQRFTPEELSSSTLSAPFGWTKQAPVLKVPVTNRSPMYSNYGPGALLEKETRLYDLLEDPGQNRPLSDADTEGRMAALMRSLMVQNEAPEEAFRRLNL